MKTTSDPTYDLDARGAEISGRPPRLLALKPEELNQQALDVADGIYTAGGRAPVPAEKLPDFIRTFVRHPRLCKAHFALGEELFKSELSFRDRELVILRVGWIAKAPFEWSAHVSMSKDKCLSAEEIERVTIGSKAEGWSDHDRAILVAVEELIDNAMIEEDTWAILARDLNDQQLLELPIMVGQYLGVAFIQNSLRSMMTPGSPGLKAR